MKNNRFDFKGICFVAYQPSISSVADTEFAPTVIVPLVGL
jgi:hypothetical protein